MIEDGDGEFLGDCGLTWQTIDGETELEVGYHVVPARQGEGIATDGVRVRWERSSSKAGVAVFVHTMSL